VRHQARVLAARIAAGARHAEHEERSPDLVEERVIVKTTADGRAIVEQIGEASWYGTSHPVDAELTRGYAFELEA